MRTNKGFDKKNRHEEKDVEFKELATNIDSLIKTIKEEIKNIMIHSKKLDNSKGRNCRGLCTTRCDVLANIFGLGTISNENENKLRNLIEQNTHTINKIKH